MAYYYWESEFPKEDCEKIIKEFNNTMKGLRGQLKGTPAKGLVNFELLDIDKKGNIIKN